MHVWRFFALFNTFSGHYNPQRGEGLIRPYNIFFCPQVSCLFICIWIWVDFGQVWNDLISIHVQRKCTPIFLNTIEKNDQHSHSYHFIFGSSKHSSPPLPLHPFPPPIPLQAIAISPSLSSHTPFRFQRGKGRRWLIYSEKGNKVFQRHNDKSWEIKMFAQVTACGQRKILCGRISPSPLQGL